MGCGDSFAGAIVLGYIRRHSILGTLALANAVGAATATRRGAGRNVAEAAKVRQLLEAAAVALDRGEAALDLPAGRAPHVEAMAYLSASLDGR